MLTGLVRKSDGAAFHRLDGGVDVAVSGHHEDRGALSEAEGFVDHFEAGFARHAKVRQDRRRRAGRRGG